jgi:hypothetical protein
MYVVGAMGLEVLLDRVETFLDADRELYVIWITSELKNVGHVVIYKCLPRISLSLSLSLSVAFAGPSTLLP